MLSNPDSRDGRVGFGGLNEKAVNLLNVQAGIGNGVARRLQMKTQGGAPRDLSLRGITNPDYGCSVFDSIQAYFLCHIILRGDLLI